MITIQLKDEVRKSIQSGWPEFESQHPHLAAAIDQQLLIEQTTARLIDDPDYQQAIAQAQAAGVAGTAVVDLVSRFVTRVLKGIV